MLVDRDAHVLQLNQVAAGIVAQRDGLSLDAGGTCRAANPPETRVLHDLIGKACEDTAPSDDVLACKISRPSQRQALSLVATSIPKDEAVLESQERALLFITDPDRPPSLDPALIAKLFSLTNSESRLACALAAGLSIEEAASEIGLSVETARTYLKRVFSKTETRRQAELVKVILSVPNVLNAYDRFDASG